MKAIPPRVAIARGAAWMFVLLAWSLVGCGKLGTRADLVFLNGAEPESIDPASFTAQPEGRIASALFEGLMRNTSAGLAEPGMAESYEISPDGRVYTFHLRADARWSNGDPVIANDFVRSWERTLRPSTACEYAYQLHYLVNAKDYNEGKLTDFSQVGVKALDDRTLQTTLENPTPFFLDLCAFATLLPVPMAAVEKWGDDWIKPGHMVSNGPFILEEWRVNDHIRLRKNPLYWDRAHVGMNTIDILPTEKGNVAYNFYSSGLADLMMDKGLAPPALIDELKKKPDFHAAPFLGNYFMRFNVTRKPFNDVRVRQAFSMVINKRTIVDKVTRAGELPATSLVPPGTAGYQPPAGLPYDPVKARRLLAEAGYPGGAGFPIISYLYKDGELNDYIAVELQGMFRQELGVNIGLLRQESKSYLNAMSRLDYDICRATWVGDYNDPNTFLDMFLTGGGNNRTGWSNAQYDGLIAAAARELDKQKRFAIFHQAETLLVHDEVPICPLYYYVGIQFYDGTKLGGIEANVIDEHPLRALYWKR